MFNLQDLLLLRDGSLISTNSGTAERAGNGGNITFEGGIVLAVPGENSDIIANAVAGDGGRIVLAAQNVIGFEISRDLTTEQLRNNQSNNISASSELGAPGEVQIFNQVEDPAEGLSELPSELLGGERLIGQSVCAEGPGSYFVVTGRGGVPRAPHDSLCSSVVWTDEPSDWTQTLRSFADDSSADDLSATRDSSVLFSPDLSSSETIEQQEISSPSLETQAVEAQGWDRLPDGRIALVVPEVSAAIAPNAPTCPMLSERLVDE